MKKYIFSVLMAAMAAFTFSSCEDVPEPYTLPTQPAGPGTTDPNQKGSESNPYTVTEAIALIKAGTAPSTAVCVKGKITAVTFFNATYSSLSYNIADEGSSEVIEVYSGKGKDGANFSSKDDLKVGQTVVVKGIVKAFTKNDGTIVNEIDKNSTIISIENTGTTSPDTPATGKGSLSDPYNVAEAIAAIKAGTAPTTQVYLTGIISDVAFYNETYKSITYYISDDGKSKDMQVYSGKGLNGADFASKEDLKVGQKVTILGKIKKFTDKNGNDVMEVDKTSSIVKIEGEGTGGGEVKPDPKPGTSAGITIDNLTVTLANSGVTAGESLKIDDVSALKPDATLTEIKLSDGTVIAFDKNSGTNPPAYNSKFNELRIYANNKMTFTASKPIAKIIFTCTYDSNKKWNAVGNETATVVFSGNTATYTNTFNGTGGGVQLRIAKMEIVYAK